MAFMDEIRAIKSTKKDLREFGLLVGGVLVLVAGFGIWKDRGWAPEVMGAGIALVASGLIVPQILTPLQKIWMALALVLGAVMSRVVITFIFFFVLTPVSLAARLTGKKFLVMPFRDGSETYWVKRGAEDQMPEASEKQY